MWIKLQNKFVTFLVAERRGVTSVEYAMIAAGIIVAIVGSVLSVGGHLPGMFNQVSSEL
jgi:Flp pilus assembly pilin Flp